MNTKHPNFPDMQSGPWGHKQDSGVPSLLASQPLGLPLGGASSSGNLSRRGLRLSCGLTWLPVLPSLGSWERLLYLASLHPQGTQLLRNSQLLPSPTLSFQTKPVKTDLQWQLWPLLATAWVHGPPAGSRVPDTPLQVQRKPGPTLSLRRIQERSAWEPMDSMCFFWLHPNQMELSICAVACPFIADTGSFLCNCAVTERLSYLPGLLRVLNVCSFLYGSWRYVAPPPHAFTLPTALFVLYINLFHLLPLLSLLIQVPTSFLHHFNGLLLVFLPALSPSFRDMLLPGLPFQSAYLWWQNFSAQNPFRGSLPAPWCPDTLSGFFKTLSDQGPVAKGVT